jgi:hypothetical protein
MGRLSALFGDASEADIADVEKNVEASRFIVVDRQGLTGRKTTDDSIPYRAIRRFAVETAGHFDLESELTIWMSGTPEPFERTFTRGQSIVDVQKALASYVGR